MDERASCNTAKEAPIAEKLQRETELLRVAYETLFRIGQMIKIDIKVGLPELPKIECMKDSVEANYEMAAEIGNTARFIYNELFGG